MLWDLSVKGSISYFGKLNLIVDISEIWSS